MKKWYQSKTVWTNVTLFLSGLAVIIGSTTAIPTNIALQINVALTLAGAVLNLALRVFFTNEAIGPKPSA